MNINYDKIYRYEWQDAIDNIYICPFNICIPNNNLIKEHDIDEFIKLLGIINDIDESTAKIIKKVYFILRSLRFYGNKKCILYAATINKALLFEKIIKGFSDIL